MLKLKWESFRQNFYSHECSLGIDWSGWIVLTNSGILKTGGLPGSWVPFHERPGNSSGPESCFMFAVFAFKIKVSSFIVLWGYQLTKPSWLVCELELCYYSTYFDFKIYLRALNVFGVFEKQASGHRFSSPDRRHSLHAPAKPTFVPQDTAKIKPHLNFTKEIRIYT